MYGTVLDVVEKAKKSDHPLDLAEQHDQLQQISSIIASTSSGEMPGTAAAPSLTLRSS